MSDVMVLRMKTLVNMFPYMSTSELVEYKAIKNIVACSTTHEYKVYDFLK